MGEQRTRSWRVKDFCTFHNEHGGHSTLDRRAIMEGKVEIAEIHDLDDIEAARLIAAAPELLEALKAAKDTIRIWHGPDAWDIYDRASPEMKVINSAIAKAEGRS